MDENKLQPENDWERRANPEGHNAEHLADLDDAPSINDQVRLLYLPTVAAIIVVALVIGGGYWWFQAAHQTSKQVAALPTLTSLAGATHYPSALTPLISIPKTTPAVSSTPTIAASPAAAMKSQKKNQPSRRLLPSHQPRIFGGTSSIQVISGNGFASASAGSGDVYASATVENGSASAWAY